MQRSNVAHMSQNPAGLMVYPSASETVGKEIKPQPNHKIVNMSWCTCFNDKFSSYKK